MKTRIVARLAWSICLLIVALVSLTLFLDFFDGTQLLEEPGVHSPRPLAKPTRQLDQRGCQPSSRLALAFDPPLTSVI